MNSECQVSQNDLGRHSESANLRPLHAQVGGHVRMKIFDERYVCKPLNRRELRFYQEIPKQLRSLVPQFIGTLDIQDNHTDSQRRCSLIKAPVNQYLVLENLTTGYKKPCVLDLKMGTRMYGDFASEAKRQSQKKKTVKSTSAKLGVRFCGSQRFSVSKNNFEKLDKYVGRKATESEFRDLLENFFNNNGLLRTDIISFVINEIRQMRDTLGQLNQFRFYSSSLLIIYEGRQFVDVEESNSSTFDSENSVDCESFQAKKRSRIEPLAKIKIIDFANATMPGVFEDDSIHEGPDSGFLLGLENLQDILESLVEYETQGRKP